MAFAMRMTFVDVICEDSLKHVYVDGEKAGFQFEARLAYYRGHYLSDIDLLEVYLDGEKMPDEAVTFELNGKEMPIYAVPLAKFAVSFAEEKGDFVGKEALLKQSEAVKRISNKDYSDMDILPMRIAAIALKDRGVMRAGMPIYHNREMVGWLTSGTMVPYYNFEGEGEGAVQLETTGKRAIGMAYINSDIPVGEIVEVDIRGRYLEAVTVSCHMRNNKPPYAQPVLSK